MVYLTLVAIRRKLAASKPLIFLILCVCLFIPLGSYMHDLKTLSSRLRAQDRHILMNRYHRQYVNGFFENREGWHFSKLGRILFDRKPIPDPNPNANRRYVVLVWKYWNWLKNRHVHNFGKSGISENNLLEGCSVTNCIFSGNESLIDTADAVLVHLQKGNIPKVKNRNRTQRWIFLNDESPKNAFSLAAKKPTLASLYNVFNWSMTYRTDADVPVPYGRVIPLATPINPDYKALEDIAAIVPNWGKKNKIAALLMSNCGVKARNEFLKEFRKHVHVDVFGGCSDDLELKHGCPGHFKADCEPLEAYLFYLVLENTSCYQYLTEKVFYHAYSKGAIPIIFGPVIEDVKSLLPPHSYLHVDVDTHMQTFAKQVNDIAGSREIILSMHMWRNHFKVVNEHGYFGTRSYHLCRVCEALNYNKPTEKIYTKELLDPFLDPEVACYN